MHNAQGDMHNAQSDPDPRPILHTLVRPFLAEGHRR
jgi:hypothetical protein